MDDMPEATYQLLMDMLVNCLPFPDLAVSLTGFLRERYGIGAVPRYGRSSTGLTLLTGCYFDPFIDLEPVC